MFLKDYRFDSLSTNIFSHNFWKRKKTYISHILLP